MSVLSYNEILAKKVIIFNDEPHVVISNHVFRKQQRKPVNVTKLKSLKNGRVVEYSFHQNENAEEAELEKKTITYIYESKGEYWFHDTKDKSQRFALAANLIGPGGRFMKANSEVEALVWGEEIIGVSLPIKVDLKVKETMAAVKGNTAQGASKEVTLETGTTIMAPMFINEGDVISINTETGTYSERTTKA